MTKLVRRVYGSFLICNAKVISCTCYEVDLRSMPERRLQIIDNEAVKAQSPARFMFKYGIFK